MESLDHRIKRLREAKGFSQQAVADRLGVSRVAVTKWENGMTANLKLSNLIGFCELFGISVEELLRGSSQKIKNEAAPSEGLELLADCRTCSAYKKADAATKAAVDLLLLSEAEHKRLMPEVQAASLLLKSFAAQELDPQEQVFQGRKATPSIFQRKKIQKIS